MTQSADAPSLPQRLPYLDGWRGIAIICVLVGHFFPVPQINLGHFGVELFFVLSGRLMAEILFIKKQELSEFFRRRFSRIYPALLVFVALTIIPASHSSAILHTKRALAEIPDAVAALTFTMNYVEAIFTRGSIYTHTWSLSVEEHSYILLAILAVIVRRRVALANMLIIAASMLCIVNGYVNFSILHLADYQVYWRTDVRAASIFLSAATCLTFHMLKVSERLKATLSIACLPIALLLFWTAIPEYVRYSLATLALALSVNSLEAAPAVLRRGLSIKVFTGIGLISYSLYLWQQPFYSAANAVRDRLGLVGIVVLLAAAFVAAVGSYFFVEQPARKAINNFRAKKGQDAVANSIAAN